MSMRVRVYQSISTRYDAAAAVCMCDLIYCRMTVCENERTTCTKVGMTFSELDVSLKVSHDECFRVKFEQDIS